MPAHVRALVRTIRDEERARTPHEVRQLPSRFENDSDRAARMERGLTTVRDILRPILDELAERRRSDTSPEEDLIREKALERARREKKGRRT
jgi:hypothetical protein